MADPVRRWEVIIEREPEKVLRRLPRDLLRRVDAHITALADNPRPEGCVKLQGFANLYRIRVGDWRITYAVEDERLVVLIVEIAPRGGAYRRLG